MACRSTFKAFWSIFSIMEHFWHLEKFMHFGAFLALCNIFRVFDHFWYDKAFYVFWRFLDIEYIYIISLTAFPLNVGTEMKKAENKRSLLIQKKCSSLP